MPTPITINVNFIDLTGNAIQGYMEANIIPPTGVNNLFVSGLGIIAPKVTISAIGSSVSVQVWGNDVVVDAQDGAVDTYYNISLFQSTGALIWNAAYLFTGSGPVNLVGYPILNPVPVPPGFIYPQQFPPGGLTGDVQFNNSGVFAGDPTFTFNSTSKQVGIGGTILVGPLDPAFIAAGGNPATYSRGQTSSVNRVAALNQATNTTDYWGLSVLNQDNLSGGGGLVAALSASLFTTNTGTVTVNDTVFPSSLAGAVFSADHIGTGALAGTNYGPVAVVASANVYSAVSVSAVTGIVADTGNGSGATIGTMTGLWVPSMGDSGSTITTTRGVYIAPQTAGASAAWGLYSDTGVANFFGGIGSTNAVQITNLTASSSGSLTQNSPFLSFNGTYWTGSASSPDSWTIQNNTGNGLVFSHTGNPASSEVTFNSTLNTVGAVQGATGLFGFSTGNEGEVLTISAAGTASAGLTTYTATVPAGDQPVLGQYITIAGFVTHTSNNGRFVVQSATLTSVVVYNSAGVAETHAATGTVDGNYVSLGGYDTALGGYVTAFPILGTSRTASTAAEALPYNVDYSWSVKGDATDAGYIRIVNDGSTGNHFTELGSIIDGTGAAPLLFQLGVIGGTNNATLNVPLYATGLATPVTVVSFSTTPTFSASEAGAFQITLTGNVSSSTLSGATAGQFLLFRVIEDGTGGRTFTWPTNVKGAMAITETAGAVNQQLFYFDGTNAYPVAPGTWV